MNAYVTTFRDLVRALSAAGMRPAVDAAIRDRAERVARALAGPDIGTTIERRGPGAFSVKAAGPNLFSREFGSLERPPEQPLARAMRRLTTDRA